MTIHQPDMDIGRCGNFRSVVDGDGVTRNVRCLDYEGTEHVCTFREPKPKMTGDWGAYSLSIYSPSKPKPWVKPERSD